MTLEIVSKLFDLPYRSGRRLEWLKTKCVQSDTFVTIGYQLGTGAVRTPLAIIKAASFDGKRLRYAGVVGPGFSEVVAKAFRERLDKVNFGYGASSGESGTCITHSPIRPASRALAKSSRA